MADPLATIRQNLAEVKRRLSAACQQADREPSGVTLIGVTKYVDANLASLLVQAGCTTLGESRPQQLWEKAKQLGDPSVRWHMIGHLQRNKVDHTLQVASLLHSIDSVRLLSAIDKSAQKQSLLADALLEVNCSGDPEKHGFTPDQLPEVVDTLPNYPHVKITGLMTMAARAGGRDVARRNFAQLRELRDQVARNAPEGTSLTELSMGMSGDFEEAILEGATMVRVGSALWDGL